MKTDTKRLCDLLYGLNYEVSIFDFTHAQPLTKPLDQVLATLIPNSKISGSKQVSADEAISLVKFGVDYIGDNSHGPVKSKIESKEFIDLRASFLAEVDELAKTSEVYSFYFDSGHPAYPVFWDFAFAFRQPQSTWILIGSSSD